MSSHEISDLIDAFLCDVEGMEHIEAGARLGVSEATVRRWREGDRRPPRPSTEGKLRRYNVARETGANTVGLAAASSWSVREAGGEAVEELLDMLGLEGGMRRAARERGPADMVRTAYMVAIDDNWPPELRKKLDQLREAILGD